MIRQACKPLPTTLTTDLSGRLARLGVVGVVVVNVVDGGTGVAARVLRVVGACRAVGVHRGWGAVGTAAVVKPIVLQAKKPRGDLVNKEVTTTQ